MLKLNKKWVSSFLVITMLGLQGCSKNGEYVNTDSSSNGVEESITNTNTNIGSNGELVNDGTVSNVGEAELHFINTGNSDAILIKQGGKYALIDGGDNDDEKKVVSYLKNQGVTELEYIFATHPHADHIGGLDAVVDNVNVKNVFVANGDADTKTYRDFINSMAKKGLSPSVPLINSIFMLGDSSFKVISVANSDNTNNNSLVLLYTNGNDKVLLMGDAEKEIEAKLKVGEVDLLKVGHHGSHSSSTPNFIKQISPKYGVIQVGEGNKYGHPHTETMDTLKANNVEVHRNDECGDIVFKSTGSGLKAECEIVGSFNSPNGKNNTTVRPTTPKEEVVDYGENIKEDTTSKQGQIVYWTKSGKKYHSTSDCSNMKNPISGGISEVGTRDACSKCW